MAVTALLPASDWTHYGRDAGGTRYSPLKQITRDNVTRLKLAWIYRTGALQADKADGTKAAFESTPILIEGVLYLTTPFNHVIALDPATGREAWKFDPKVDRDRRYSELTNRGVAAWKDPAAGWRLFMGTIDARLIALDANTGKPVFEVDLTDGVDLKDKGDYQVTSPPAVSGSTVIVGSALGDNRRVDVERGIVRGYDARTGKLQWTWNPLPWAEKDKVRTGAANAWAPMSIDEKRGLVFLSTSSPSPDFYGGERKGDNRHANSVVALRASDGEVVWSYQVVHHDLWDYDIAAQPTLIRYRGKDAVVAATKMGHIFVLDRDTGKPLHPVEERAVPKSDVPGEESHPTQPFPSLPAVVPQKLAPEDAWGATPEDQRWCAEQIRSMRSEGIFTPPSLKGSITFPGNAGGITWGGVAVNPEGLLVVNTNRLPFVVRLIPRAELAGARRTASENRMRGEFGAQLGAPYAMYREPLWTRERVPCNPPPWGAITALDLNQGRIVWEKPLGTAIPGKSTGTPSFGAPILTAAGLVFIAAAMDNRLRAFDTRNGEELWSADLPAGGQATPMTYSHGGKQYIVLCAGGHGKLGTELGDYVVAYALE
jgi:quinoprotein glucose dehydrogenase